MAVPPNPFTDKRGSNFFASDILRTSEGGNANASHLPSLNLGDRFAQREELHVSRSMPDFNFEMGGPETSELSSLSAIEILLAQLAQRKEGSTDSSSQKPETSRFTQSNQNNTQVSHPSDMLGAKTSREQTLEDFLHQLILKDSLKSSNAMFDHSSVPGPRHQFKGTYPAYPQATIQNNFSTHPQPTGNPTLRPMSYPHHRNNDEATTALKNMLRIPTATSSPFNPASTTSSTNRYMNTGYPSRMLNSNLSEYIPRAQGGSSEGYPSGYFQNSLGQDEDTRRPSFFSGQSNAMGLPTTSNETFNAGYPLQNLRAPLTPFFSEQSGTQGGHVDAFLNSQQHGVHSQRMDADLMYASRGLSHFNFGAPSSPPYPSARMPSQFHEQRELMGDAKRVNMLFSGPLEYSGNLNGESLPHGIRDLDKNSLTGCTDPFYANPKHDYFGNRPVRHQLMFTPRRPNGNFGGYARRRSSKTGGFNGEVSNDWPRNSLYKLSLCLPITIPYGTIHVTKASGENFYSFSNTGLCPEAKIRENASILFSPSAGICDAWASFLHVRAGYIFNVKPGDIAHIVDLFHAVLKLSSSDNACFETPLKLTCKGLYVCATSATSQWKPKNNVSDRKLETRGFFQDSHGPVQFFKLCEWLRSFRTALHAVFDTQIDTTQFPEAVQACIQRFKEAVQDGRENITPSVYLRSMFDISMESDLENFPGLPIVVREYGQVENQELEEKFMMDKEFAEAHEIPDVQISELRIEHQSKKMVDPRFRDNFVLTRQIAGDENPQQWNGTRRTFQQFVDNTSKLKLQPQDSKILDAKQSDVDKEPEKPGQVPSTSTEEQETTPEDCNKTVLASDSLGFSVNEPLSNTTTADPSSTSVPLDTTKTLAEIAERTFSECKTPYNAENKALSITSMTRPSYADRIGRYELCSNVDVPLVEIAYCDAKDCLSSTHGFIYARHLMAQNQQLS